MGPFLESYSVAMGSAHVAHPMEADTDCNGDEHKLQRMQQCVRTLLQGVGEDVEREGLRDTPKRVAKAFLDMTEGYRQSSESVLGEALFHEPLLSSSSAAGSIVLVRDIDFASLSEDSLLPFHGRAHIAYAPSGGVVLGLSKLARLTRMFAKRVQTQERLTRDVLSTLMAALAPLGAAVVVEARHLSLARQQQLPRRTVAAAGSFLAAPDLLLEALAMLQLDPLDVHVCTVVACACDAATAAAVAGTGAAAHGAACRCCCSCSGSGAATPAGAGDATSSGPLALRRERSEPALAPPTPDPSEHDSDAPDEQLSCSQSEPSPEGMEAAVAALLSDAGVPTAGSAALQAACRRYVMSFLASTSGAHQELSQAALRQQRLSAPRAPPPASRRAGGCGAGAWAWQQWAGVAHHLPFTSQCEHHLLPFQGSVHVLYLLPPAAAAAASEAAAPTARLPMALTDGEVEQVVVSVTQRLQLQERITQQVAEALVRLTGAAGVLVCCRAAHMCMVARGVENHSGTTVTRAALGEAAAPAAAPLRSRFAAYAARHSSGGGGGAGGGCGATCGAAC